MDKIKFNSSVGSVGFIFFNFSQKFLVYKTNIKTNFLATV